MTIYKPGKPEQITPESGNIPQKTVKPSKMWSHKFNHKPYIYHCKKSPDTYDIPLPAAEKQITRHNREQYESGINPYLDFRERPLHNLADNYLNTLAWHGDRSAPDLKGNPYTHDRTPYRLDDQLRKQCITMKTGCQHHINVNQPSEHKPYHKLKQLHGVEPTSQNKHLTQHQNKIHHNRVASYSQSGDLAIHPRQGEHKRKGGDNTAPQTGFHTKNDSQRHQIQ